LYLDPLSFGLAKPHFSINNPDLDHDWCELISLREEK
jgi:hypothetical protein